MPKGPSAVGAVQTFDLDVQTRIPYAMPHSYSANHLHIVFSTRERRKQITAVVRPKLWAYIAGVGRNHSLIIHEVGGYEDHTHVLLSLPATVLLAHAIRDLKAVSSKWMHGNGVIDFAWQEGYAAFSASESNMTQVRRYIRAQEEHHRRVAFEDEFRQLLRRYLIAFDEKYVFG